LSRYRSKDFIKSYDEARLKFIEEVKAIIKKTNREVVNSSNSPYQHDYLGYLVTFFGSSTLFISSQKVLSFDEWKEQFCGADRVCRPEKDLEDY